MSLKRVGVKVPLSNVLIFYFVRFSTFDGIGEMNIIYIYPDMVR